MTNRSARALSGGRTGHIGLTIPLMRGDYFAAILEGALEAVYEEDMRLVLYTTLHEHDREVSVLERLSDGATDGAIILLPLESSGELGALQESGFPFVVVDRASPSTTASPPSRRRTGRAHWRRPSTSSRSGIAASATMSGPAGWAATTERIEGYHSALAVAGVLPTSELIVEGNFEAPPGSPPPTFSSTWRIVRPRSSRRTTTWPPECCRWRTNAG